MNKTGWIIFSTVVVLLLGGLVAWTRITNPPIDVSGVEHNTILAGTDASGNIGDHVKANKDSKLLLIEYGDYQCPSCASAHPNITTLIEEYGDKFAFVFRNFPLTSIHPNALAASATAEAAGVQGKFWEMHNLLYDNQSDWSGADAKKRTELFNQYASSLNLDLDTFKSDLADKPVNQKIKFDIALGKHIDVRATPTFFLNGKKLDEATASGITQGNLTAIKAKIDELSK